METIDNHLDSFSGKISNVNCLPRHGTAHSRSLESQVYDNVQWGCSKEGLAQRQ